MIMVKTMIRTRNKSSVSLAITTSGLSPTGINPGNNMSKEDASLSNFDRRLAGQVALNPLIHLGKLQRLN